MATTHALWWNNIKPVFVDIEPEYCNIDANKIEAAITPRTTAILPVHVYGNPANVARIQEIADLYGLKVIYDAAHAFGVKYNNSSLFDFGDISVLSFHATKVFNTFEGGAVICKDEKTKKRIDFLKNFGFADELTVITPGINAKMNEFQCALGILQLKYFNKIIERRKRIVEEYINLLQGLKGIRYLYNKNSVENNYAYFPIFINSNETGINRDDLYEHLKKFQIYTRRYFYPLISQFPAYRDLPSSKKENLPIADKISKEVLCLPIYPDLPIKTVENIANIIRDAVE